jgi:hypothetical protein
MLQHTFYLKQENEMCCLLGYYAASSGCTLTNFWGQQIVSTFIGIEQGTDWLSRTVGKGLPLDAGNIAEERRKPEVMDGTPLWRGYFRSLKMGPIGCPETSVKDYHLTPCNIAEERNSHQHRCGNLKSGGKKTLV